jgi:NadR type nicotinamide-nucleotide adenylyltransferase
MHPKKVVVIGPECTGKSTLCAVLADALKTVWAPEYARQFLDNLGRPYEEPDLVDIATGQLLSEDSLLPRAGKILLCDTDLHVLKTWSHERYGRCHRRILEAVAVRQYDAYILTYPDVVWTPDPQREHPDPADRLRLWRHYHDAVQNAGLPWLDLRGAHEIRVRSALHFISSLA